MRKALKTQTSAAMRKRAVKTRAIGQKRAMQKQNVGMMRDGKKCAVVRRGDAVSSEHTRDAGRNRGEGTHRGCCGEDAHRGKVRDDDVCGENTSCHVAASYEDAKHSADKHARSQGEAHGGNACSGEA
eukprot:6195398-Pleurochrysis_carterae.AAC.1